MIKDSPWFLLSGSGDTSPRISVDVRKGREDVIHSSLFPKGSGSLQSYSPLRNGLSRHRNDYSRRERSSKRRMTKGMSSYCKLLFLPQKPFGRNCGEIEGMNKLWKITVQSYCAVSNRDVLDFWFIRLTSE